MARKVVVVAAMKKKEKGRKIGAKRHRKLILERCARVCVCVRVYRTLQLVEGWWIIGWHA